MKNLLGRIARRFSRPKFSSSAYWESRYNSGGHSGSGSYGRLATFKAGVINNFVEKEEIGSVIEFGCGDGNQLSLANYPKYIGLDISVNALGRCRDRFKSDATKSFFLYNGQAFVDNGGFFLSDLSLSLDVLYHLVEQDVYDLYLTHLFSESKRFVIIYSSNIEHDGNTTASHERHRIFTNDVARIAKNWQLIDEVGNHYKPKTWDDEEGSIANFYFYEKRPLST